MSLWSTRIGVRLTARRLSVALTGPPAVDLIGRRYALRSESELWLASYLFCPGLTRLEHLGLQSVTSPPRRSHFIPGLHPNYSTSSRGHQVVRNCPRWGRET